MGIGYFTGDKTFVKPRGGSAAVSVPEGKSAVLALRAVRSGKLHLGVGKNARLVISAMDEPTLKKHKLSISADVQDNSTCIIILNFRGKAEETVFDFSCNAGTNSRAVLNTIIGHNGKFAGNITASAGKGAVSHINGLVYPSGKGAEATISVLCSHIHGGSSSQVEWVGSIRESGRCNFKGEIYVPEGLKDVQASMRGRFLAAEGSSVHAIPILRIHSRDTRATHGISVSNLAGDELHYMESRGIAPEDAAALVEHGIISTMLDKMAKTLKL